MLQLRDFLFFLPRHDNEIPFQRGGSSDQVPLLCYGSKSLGVLHTWAHSQILRLYSTFTYLFLANVFCASQKVFRCPRVKAVIDNRTQEKSLLMRTLWYEYFYIGKPHLCLARLRRLCCAKATWTQFGFFSPSGNFFSMQKKKTFSLSRLI